MYKTSKDWLYMIVSHWNGNAKCMWKDASWMTNASHPSQPVEQEEGTLGHPTITWWDLNSSDFSFSLSLGKVVNCAGWKVPRPCLCAFAHAVPVSWKTSFPTPYSTPQFILLLLKRPNLSLPIPGNFFLINTSSQLFSCLKPYTMSSSLLLFIVEIVMRS